MLSNTPHFGNANPCTYGDELPRFTTFATDDNGDETVVVVNRVEDYDDVSASSFSLRSVLKNGIQLDAMKGSPFNRLSHRDDVVSFVEISQEVSPVNPN